MDEKKLEISLEALEKMSAKTLAESIESKITSQEEIEQITFQEANLDKEDTAFLVNELIIGAGEYDSNIQTVYQHWEKEGSVPRSGILTEAYNFISNNWEFISAAIYGLRKLGYLKIEENSKVKALIDKMKKKDNKQEEKDSD